MVDEVCIIGCYCTGEIVYYLFCYTVYILDYCGNVYSLCFVHGEVECFFNIVTIEKGL